MPDSPAAAPRLARSLAFALVAAVAMSLTALAGWWQWQRFEYRQEAISQFEAGAAAPPLTAAAVAASDSHEVRYYRAEVEGRFVAGSATLLRNRNVGGRPATGVLAWFSTDSGALLVQVGWREYSPEAVPPELPSGRQSLEVTLQADEPDDGRRDPGATRINAAQMPAVAGDVLPGYGVIDEDCADCVAVADAVGVSPAQVDRPSPGPHLSYALQWWSLTLLIPVGAVLLARRDAENATDAAGAGARGGDVKRDGRASRDKPRRRRVASDEEVEDAL